jgi:hypothetical protein
MALMMSKLYAALRWPMCLTITRLPPPRRLLALKTGLQVSTPGFVLTWMVATVIALVAALFGKAFVT